MLSISTYFIDRDYLKKGNIILIHRPQQNGDILIELDHAELGTDHVGNKVANFYTIRSLNCPKSYELLPQYISELSNREEDWDSDSAPLGFRLENRNNIQWIFDNNVVVLLLKDSIDGKEITDSCQI